MTTNSWLIALNAVLNVVQALGIAYIAAKYYGAPGSPTKGAKSGN